jgi:hypothetical protein
MWASQCNSHTRDYDRSNTILPLSDSSQRALEAALVAAKEKALAVNPVTTFAHCVAGGTERSSSCDHEPLCAVCLVNFEGSTPVRVTSCQHMFCADCLAAFVNQCRRLDLIVCPLCRNPLVDAAAACDTPVADPNGPVAPTYPPIPPQLPQEEHDEPQGYIPDSATDGPPTATL